MALEQNTRIEMAAFVAWLQDKTEGAPAAVKAWLGTQKYQGKARPYENIDHLKTCARFHGPKISMEDIDAALAAFRADGVD